MDPQLLAACVIASAYSYGHHEIECSTIADDAFALYDAIMWRVNERNRKIDKRREDIG